VLFITPEFLHSNEQQSLLLCSSVSRTLNYLQPVNVINYYCSTTAAGENS